MMKSYELEAKAKAAEWHTQVSKVSPHIRETPMFMIFAKETSNRVPTGQTINGKYCRKYINNA